MDLVRKGFQQHSVLLLLFIHIAQEFQRGHVMLRSGFIGQLVECRATLFILFQRLFKQFFQRRVIIVDPLQGFNNRVCPRRFQEIKDAHHVGDVALGL